MSGMRAAELLQYKLQPALEECALHRLRLRRLVGHVPMLEQAYAQMDHFAQARKTPE